jgi:hypothetical protein
MRCSIAVCTSIVLAAAAPASAHRLDEYLQALRVDVRGDAIVLELDLTPGANLAADIVSVLDPEGDGAIDSNRSEAYATEVARSLELAIDGGRSTLALVNRQFPSVDKLRAGSGVIRVVMRADVAHAGGSHQLRVENGFRSDVSVYLANALRPDGGAVTIASQRREPSQRTLTLDYVVGPPPLTRFSVAWTSAALLLFGCGAYWRRRD